MRRLWAESDFDGELPIAMTRGNDGRHESRRILHVIKHSGCPCCRPRYQVTGRVNLPVGPARMWEQS